MSGTVPKLLEEKEECYKNKKCGDNCEYCFINAKKSLYSRKCFMTGEYCSKQTSIERERKELHDKHEINAFVIMSFSDMTNVVYEWRIKRFIEKLKKYFFFDKDNRKIFCSKHNIKAKNELTDEELDSLNGNSYNNVKEIHVERGDTDVASNYVMCSRICQRIQIADLIVVDVTHQNPNVFYELGMAVALGKMILPICFSESFYRMSVPELVKETDENFSKIEHHIGCYPWRKDLFEYYGLFQTQSDKKYDEDDKSNEDDIPRKTYYMKYEDAINIEFGFSDIQYNRFPYDAEIHIENEKEDGSKNKRDDEKIGKKLYDELKESYNHATKVNNTLLVYTMDGFLNGDDAGICIVNFFHTITAKMQEEQCFCGDRVGVLVQGNGIPDEDKDSEKQIDLFYRIGAIIHIGVNQATYLSEEEKLKTDDVIASRKVGKENKEITEKQRNEILRAVKGYMRNRGVIVYPKNPVYVKKEVDKLTYKKEEKILQEEHVLERSKVCNCTSSKVRCLYHKVLHSLRYVNEVVIDISNNSIHSLFWLGVAHGSSVNAITVLHDATEIEREKITGSKDKKNRSVFDVSGLWTAILHSNDTQGFYRQLAQAQYGIEQHAKLVLNDKDIHEKKLHNAWSMMGERFAERDIETVYKDEKKEMLRKLESYYRSRFWNAMLRHNQLLICMPQIDDSKKDKEEPRGYTSKWDFKAASLLSHYLSKRTVISEYRIEALKDKTKPENIEQSNFISFGSEAKPLGETLTSYILNNGNVKCGIYEHDSKGEMCQEGEDGEVGEVGKEFRIYKGFKEVHKEKNELKESGLGLYTQHPIFECVKRCSKKRCLPIKNKIIFKASELETCECTVCGRGKHTEIAQLIIWRESSNNVHEKTVFRVAVNGSSGPATLGLSSILIGDDQKIELFQMKTEMKEDVYKYDKNLLYDLQLNVRTQFMDKYRSALYEKMNKILDNKGDENNKPYDYDQKERYKELVWYAVSTYFYNELYCYFLPLLSDKDIHSLCNGMYNFVNHIRMEKESPFDIDYPNEGDSDFETSIDGGDVSAIIEEIPKILSSLLKEFRGLEAFYEVKVRHHSSKGEKREDTREVVDIKILDVENSINCLWVNNQEEIENAINQEN